MILGVSRGNAFEKPRCGASLVSRVRSDFTVSGCDNAVCCLLLAWKSGVRTSRNCVPGCGPRGFGPAWRSGPGSCCWPVKGFRTPRSPPGSGEQANSDPLAGPVRRGRSTNRSGGRPGWAAVQDRSTRSAEPIGPWRGLPGCPGATGGVRESRSSHRRREVTPDRRSSPSRSATGMPTDRPVLRISLRRVFRRWSAGIWM